MENTNSLEPITVQIIHFDDEPNSIFPIANSLFNRYTLLRQDWIIDPPKYNKWVEEFILRPQGQPPHRIQYIIEGDDRACRKLISDANVRTAIVLLDLEWRNVNRTEAAGKQLYTEARHKFASADQNDSSKRVFVCTAYPNYLEEINRGADVLIDPEQVIWKPFSPGRFAARLANLMPPLIRLEENK